MKISFLNQLLSKSSQKLLTIAAGGLLLAACSTAPQTIQFEQPSASFIQVAQTPDSFVGNQVRWGGIVARVENLERDSLIEIVNLPLDRRARPLASQQTGGRFIARVQGFVDPIIYQQGKEITVVGVLSSPMPGKIGQHSVNFPVVDTSGHHLWQERPAHQHIEVYSHWDPFWFYSRSYRWHYPYYNYYPRYPHRYPRSYPHHRREIRRVDSPFLQQQPETNSSGEQQKPQVQRRHQPRVHQSRVQQQREVRPNVNSMDRVTMRQRPEVDPQIAIEKPQALEKPAVVKPRVPKTPRRIQPKIHQERIPKPSIKVRKPKDLDRLR